jgi:hypothetical protein
VPYPYPAPLPPAPYSPYASPAPAWTPPVIVGVVLGTIVVGGFLYLLVRGPGGYFYRYPYYGAYYRYYYRPYYRPYYGPYRYVPPFVYGPYRFCPAYRGYGYWCR